MTCQIKIAVVGKISDRIPVTDHTILQFQSVVLVKDIADLNLRLSRIALIHMRAVQREGHTALSRFLKAFRLPNSAVIVVWPAVKIVGAVVGFQRIIHSVDRHIRTANAVSIPPNRRSQMRRIGQVVFHTVISQDYIFKFTFPIRRHHGNPNRTQSNKGSRYPLPIGQGVAFYIRSIRHSSK